MLNSFLNLPIFLMCLITVLAAAGMAVFALKIVRKTFGWESFQENHEVGGFLFNALGLIYAVLIAFVVFASWEDYNDAKVVCENEANTLHDLYLNSEGLPPNVQPLVKEKISEYLQEVIEKDWHLLEKGEANPESKEILVGLWRVYMNLDSLDDDKQQIIFNESLDKLNEITDYRRLRILSSNNHIPAIIWTVILIGALTSVGFSMFFGTKSFAVQATMTSLFAVTNAIIILMILSLDHPFTGDIKISTEPYIYVYNYLQSYVPQ